MPIYCMLHAHGPKYPEVPLYAIDIDMYYC
jgi:hypothetical protein